MNTSIRNAVLLIALGVLSGCNGNDGTSASGQADTTVSFSAFVVEQVQSMADSAAPVDINSTVFAIDEDNMAFDSVL